ncbi:hypothetical protein BCT30_23720 [Enterovibrio norvegicus]|nr:carboxypeptidase-like regulatory domain-containing protein [Enterovibrio norvegicus]SFO88306.1 hypothetical protein SAMN03084138_00745 [Enterovibrio norvegicus DSM 15893]OEF56536.1 hypothetical protein A1OU_17425 [Enterovibrio norvegicus]PMH65090.1 hypothetical protein BCU62_13820 [Enterovibrio norvegicus]PMI29729.1 hypothetical protein BCU47_19180 [Enterovibrio norvegicus]PMI32017.1 hypothetical protein BCU46_23650 [Enterovibrio norvegicus]
MRNKTWLLLLGCVTSLAWAQEKVSDDLMSRMIPLNQGKHAASVHGNTALVGNQLYKKQDGYWTLGKMLPVSVSNQGSNKNIAVHEHNIAVGEPSIYGPAGKISLFKRDYTTWPYQWEASQEIAQTSSSQNRWGQTVYVDNDLLAFTVSVQRVDVYKKNNGQWVFNRSLELPEGAVGELGTDIRRSGDDLLVSVYKANKVHVYSISNQLSLKQVIRKPNAIGEYQSFGWSFDVEGDLLAVAAYGSPGNVQTYQRNEVGEWEEEALITASNPNGYFGHDVELSEGQLFVGDDENTSIYHFARDNADAWSMVDTIRGSEYSFGYAFDVDKGAMFVASSFSASLFTKAMYEVSLTGRVIDRLGVSLKNVDVSGYLYDVKTDESGIFQLNVPVNWSGQLTAYKRGFDEADSQAIRWVGSDTVLSDFSLTSSRETLTIKAFLMNDGCDLNKVKFENLSSKRRGRAQYLIAIPYGWSGEIKPVAENCEFFPESEYIDYASDDEVFGFFASGY